MRCRYAIQITLAALSVAVWLVSPEDAAAGPRRRAVTVVAAAPAQAPMLGGRIYNYGKHQDEGFAHLRTLGLRYVFIPLPPLKEVDAVQKKLAANGLKTLVARGEVNLTTPNGYEGFAPQLEAAQKLGIKYIFLSPKHPNVSKEDACDRLRSAGELAKKYGITLVLETHPDLGTNADEHLATMKRINHPNVRVNFDTGNITFYNKGLNAVDELKKVLPYVATVEIKDHNGQYQTWNFPAFGRGVVDIPGVLKVLKEHGYSGPITMEIEGITGVERSLDQIKQEIADSVKYLRTLGTFR